MAKDCLYCGLQFSDTTKFCSNCGRPTERGFRILPIQKSKFNHLSREPKEKDDPLRRQRFYSSRRGPLVHKDCLYCGLQFSNTTKFCHNCGRPMETIILRKGAALPQSREQHSSRLETAHRSIVKEYRRSMCPRVFRLVEPGVTTARRVPAASSPQPPLSGAHSILLNPPHRAGWR